MSDLGALPTAPVTPIGEVLARSYQIYADRTAVAGADRSLTYAQLRERAAAVAGGLLKLGCTPGDRVALISPNSTQWFEVDHACYLGGFLRVAPLTRLHPQELARIVEDAEPTVLLAETGWLTAAGTEWIPAGIEHVVTIGGEPLPGTSAYEHLVAAGRGVDLPPAEPDNDVWIMYTSGSTGLPKGVLCGARGIGATVRNILAEMKGLGSGDVAVHTAPLSHFSGAVALGVFAAGGTNVVYPAFDQNRLAHALHNHEVTLLPLVPTQINMLTDELIRRRDAGNPVDTVGLRQIIYAGSAIAPDRLQRAAEVFGEILLQFYGSTEVPMPMTALQPEDHRTDAPNSGGLPRLASAGRPNRYTEIRIIDDDGSPASTGTPGEITARGEQRMRGYWRNPEATRKVLDAQGWVRTGDVGFLDEDGFLFIVDRKKDMIVSGGFNVYPREVENVISAMAGVAEVAVVGAPSERWGEEITAVVSPRPGVELTRQAVIDHCREAIAGYKVPKRVLFVDELPKSGVGKIQKRLIADELWAGRERRV
jgi:acyl-CoA synthetase (AMP-forming)/AMP-acid ligase II